MGAGVVSEMGEPLNEDGSHKGFFDGEPLLRNKSVGGLRLPPMISGC